MKKEQSPKPLIIRPEKNQKVIILPPNKEGGVAFRFPRIEVTGTKISIERTALELLDELVTNNAERLITVLGSDIDAKQILAIDLRVNDLIKELRSEGRTDKEVVSRMYEDLHDIAKRAGEEDRVTRAKVRKLYGVLKTTAEGHEVRI